MADANEIKKNGPSSLSVKSKSGECRNFGSNVIAIARSLVVNSW